MSEYSLVDGKVSTAKRAAEASPSGAVAGFVNAGRKFALTPKAGGVVLSVEGSEERREYPQEIRAAMLAIDGNLYLFGPDRYLLVKPDENTMAVIGGALDQWPARSAPISDRWGRAANAFPPGASVTAALVRGDHTFLVSGASYVRYSDAECLLIDAGYPRSLAGNPDGLPATAFKAALEGPDERVYFFTGTQYVVGDALSVQIANQSRWGRIRSNILVRGIDTAYRVDGKHYLFSGDEVASYTAGGDGKLPIYMDGAPVRAELGSFGAVRGVFAYNSLLYLVGRDSFICCKTDFTRTASPAISPQRAGRGVASRSVPAIPSANQLIRELARRPGGLCAEPAGRHALARHGRQCPRSAGA